MSTSPFDADRPPSPTRERTGEPWWRADPRESWGKVASGARRGRRRGDPNATVPEAEFTSYYGRNVIQPPPWTHDIAAYLFLGGLAAGSGLIGAGAAFTGRPTLRRRSRIAAIASLALGGAALARDLGRPERALNMMRTVKLTSPMSVGSWILAAFGAAAGGALACEVGRAALPPGSGLGRAAAFFDLPAAATSAFFAPPLAAYTAVLLSDTAVPTWHAAYKELPALFVSSAMAAGAGLAMVHSPTGELGPVRQLAVLAAASDLVAGEVMSRHLGELAEPLHQGRAGALHTAAQVLTLAGAVGALVSGRSRLAAAASGVALVAGSACTRFAVFHAGMESAKDPKYTVVPQRARADQAAAQGRGVTDPGGDWPR